MTVRELINALETCPQGNKVEIGTIDMSCGAVMRVIIHDTYVELESNESLM